MNNSSYYYLNSISHEINEYFWSIFSLFLFPIFIISIVLAIKGHNKYEYDNNLILTDPKKLNYIINFSSMKMFNSRNKEEISLKNTSIFLLSIKKNESVNIGIVENQIERGTYRIYSSLLQKFWLLITWVYVKIGYKIMHNWKNSKSSLVGLLFAIIFFCQLSELYLDSSGIDDLWWISEVSVQGKINMKVDSLSGPFTSLNGFIFPIAHISNWSNIFVLKEYYICIMIILEWLLTVVFLVNNFIFFYVSFESTLPMLFFLIGLYGASQKFRAGFYIFLYTLFGSLFMLLSFVKMNGDLSSSSFYIESTNNMSSILQIWLWVALFISFSVKTPIVPAHIWLPLAHSDANVSGSIILASVVLKLALYGFIRIIIGILHYCTKLLNPFVMAICTISIIYSSLSTIRQFDLKVLIAYSSIAHMGSTILGAFSDTLYGIVGSILFGLAHGFVSPALFILIGAILYDRCGSRIINYYRGLTNIIPLFALLFLLFLFGNMGVPLTANFLGEFLSLLAAFQSSIFIVSLATMSVIFSAVYSIFLYNRITSGTVSIYIKTIPDLFRREFFILLPLIICTVIFGIYPYFFTRSVEYGLSSFLL